MYKVASLFSGCGGADLGIHGGFNFLNNFYESLPFEVIYANEIDSKIAELYNKNFSIKCDVRDIRDVESSDVPDHDILVGGFPCQSFSIVAQNPKRLGYKDNNGKLFFEMCKILKQKRPQVFIAENVKGILSANKGQAFPLIINEFKECGYNLKWEVLNAADYGVPQNRFRVFIIGVRSDLDDFPFNFPKPSHSSCLDDDQLLKHVSLKSIIFPDRTIEPKYYFSQRAVEGLLRAKKEMNKGRAQDVNKPCNTVGAHLAKVSLNGTDPVLKIGDRYRRFTPREVARIQSFPEAYKLIGSEFTQYKALGNAIPPVLIWHIANKLARALADNDKKMQFIESA